MTYSREIAEYHAAERMAAQAAIRAHLHDRIVGLLNAAREVVAEGRSQGIDVDQYDEMEAALSNWFGDNRAEVEE